MQTSVNGRDTSRDGRRNRFRNWLLTSAKPVWDVLNRIEPIHKPLNRYLLDNAILFARTRPHPFSTRSDYTSVESLRDKTFFARHLPPAAPKRLPPVEQVLELFARRGRMQASAKSSMLFASFAQWFTDGFLLTDFTQPEKNHSTHEIDMAQLYGLRAEVTHALRLHSNAPGRRGRLKTQTLRGEEYPPFLYDAEGHKLPEFAALPDPGGLRPQMDRARLHSLFAFGGERTNSTPQTAMLNILMLREHNRICAEIERENPEWDDERVFETARNVVILLVLRVVVDEYINHISPYHHDFTLDPTVAWRARWNRPNWFAVELNLLYRWHSLIPDDIEWGEESYALDHWPLDNRPLIDSGLAVGFDASSRQPAGEITLGNTHPALMHTEQRAIEQGRHNRLASYNDYREAMGFPRVKRFEQISSSPAVLEGLKRLYGHVDDVEFYVGLFAEDPRPNAAVPALLGRMVAVDAFSQALTNPLCSEHIYNAATFSPAGMRILESTRSLRDIVERNVAGAAGIEVSMTLHGAGRQRQDAQSPAYPLAAE